MLHPKCMKFLLSLFICMLMLNLFSQALDQKKDPLTLKEIKITRDKNELTVSVIKVDIPSDSELTQNSKMKELFVRENNAVLMLVNDVTKDKTHIACTHYCYDFSGVVPKTLHLADVIYDKKLNLAYLAIADFKTTNGKIYLYKVNLSDLSCDFSTEIYSKSIDKWPKENKHFASHDVDTFSHGIIMVPTVMVLSANDQFNKFEISLSSKGDLENKKVVLTYENIDNEWKVFYSKNEDHLEMTLQHDKG